METNGSSYTQGHAARRRAGMSSLAYRLPGVHHMVAHHQETQQANLDAYERHDRFWGSQQHQSAGDDKYEAKLKQRKAEGKF